MKDAFQILHCDTPLKVGTLQSGTNLLSNPGFETGDFTGWATHTNWTVVATASLTPRTNGNYGLRAGSGASATTATLESNRVAVTANAYYYLQAYYGVGGTKTANTLVVKVRWWTGAVGGSPIREDTLRAAPVPPDVGHLRGSAGRFRAPGTANYASVQAVNTAQAGLTATGGTVLDDIFLGAEVTASEPPLVEAPLPHRSLQRAQSFDQLVYSTNFRSGYKECHFTIYGDPAWLWSVWLLNALGQRIKIHFDHTRVFEGSVWTMEGLIDGVPRRVSMDSIVNYLRVYYRGGYFYTVQDTPSQKRYGRIDRTENQSEMWQNEARDRANYIMLQHAQPRPSPDWARGFAGENNSLQVTVMGNWATLGLVHPAGGWRGSVEMDVSEVICLSTSSTTILGYIRKIGNLYISDDYSRVQLTGRTIRPRDPTDAPKGADAISLLKTWLDAGDVNHLTLVSGVWENSQFVVRPRPTTYEYVALGEGQYGDAGGARLPKPVLQAGRFLRASRPVPVGTSYSADVASDPSCNFLSEVTYSAETDELTFATPDTAALDTSLAGAMDLPLT